MRVEDILQAKGTGVETIGPEASMVMVIHTLVSRGVGAVVVSKDGNTVEGLISERDIVKGLHRFGSGVREMRAREIMSRNVPTCSPEDPIQRAMAEMTRSRSRHLPVVRGNALCGIISVGDVVKHRLEELELETNVLRDRYIAGR